MNLGSTIKVLRQIRKVSQADLAKAIDVERPYLSSVEQGHSQPSLKLIRDIACHLHIPPALLILGEGDSSDPIHQQLQSIWGMVLTIKSHELINVPEAKHQNDSAPSASPESATGIT